MTLSSTHTPVGKDTISQLATVPVVDQIEWALENLPGNYALASSFGIQSAVMLHLVTTIKPDIPVILIDTGYLFEETYKFIDEMTQRLRLNLQVFKPRYTPRELEQKFGQLWLRGKDGLDSYNQIVKVEPMARALDETGANTWFTGLRKQQSMSRKNLNSLQIQDGRYKLLPVLEWSNKDVHYYLKKHNLPYHPLWDQGYVSVGDTHTSQPLSAGMTEEQTRFFGIQRECGIHVIGNNASTLSAAA